MQQNDKDWGVKCLFSEKVQIVFHHSDSSENFQIIIWMKVNIWGYVSKSLHSFKST